MNRARCREGDDSSFVFRTGSGGIKFSWLRQFLKLFRRQLINDLGRESQLLFRNSQRRPRSPDGLSTSSPNQQVSGRSQFEVDATNLGLRVDTVLITEGLEDLGAKLM